MPPTYSFVIPVHNEAESLPLLVAALGEVLPQLDGEAEVVFVDDGSTDHSYEMLLALHAADERCKVVHLARNFGHQIAGGPPDLVRNDPAVIGAYLGRSGAEKGAVA